ncbi:hypothetical protein D9M71_744170 [compost metagenome]
MSSKAARRLPTILSALARSSSAITPFTSISAVCDFSAAAFSRLDQGENRNSTTNT